MDLFIRNKSVMLAEAIKYTNYIFAEGQVS